MEKLIRTSRILDKLFKVIRCITIVAGIICIPLLIVSFILPESWYAETAGGVNTLIWLDTVKLQLNRSVPVSGTLKSAVSVILLLAITGCGVIAYGLQLLRNILAPMKDGNPFNNAVSLNLRKLGWLTVIGSVVYSVISAVSLHFISGLYDLTSLFKEGSVDGITVNYHYNIAFLIVAALLFLLSHIFRYGEELQRQSDETL